MFQIIRAKSVAGKTPRSVLDESFLAYANGDVTQMTKEEHPMLIQESSRKLFAPVKSVKTFFQ